MNAAGAIRSRIERLQAGFDSASPPALFAGYLFFSVLLLVTTYACGLGRFSVELPDGQTRIKGFFWELNWGINHLFFIPIGLFCCSLVIREIARQLERISRAHMAVEGAYKELPLAALQRDWHSTRPGPVLFGLILSLALAAAWFEWGTGSLGRVYGWIEKEPSESVGWTSRAAGDPSINHLMKAANVALSFMAFTAQGLVVAFFCYTVAVVLAFAIWIYRYENGSDRKLIPNVGSTDVRLGFEVFEPLMLRLLCMALAFTFVLFLIRMQIIYNHSRSTAPTALEFVLRDVVAGFFTNIAAVFAGQNAELFEISLAPVWGTVASCAAMVLIVSLVTAFPTVILYFLAQGSRDALKNCLEEPDCPPCSSRGMAKADCGKKLETMDFWPMRYPRPVELLAYIVFAGFCFMFYKFTVLLFGAFAMRLVYVVYQVLSRKVPAPNGRPAAS